MNIRQLLRSLTRGETLAPITGWEDAFADSRAQGHNTDAYTFQIAWAYAKEHFERAAKESSDADA